ncbi:MAG: MASE3 domain-containing protein [Anaerolineae bacterium]
MSKRTTPLYTAAVVLISAAILGGLYLARQYNYLLFHGLVEVVSIVIAAAVFLVAWNARRFQSDGYLVFLGMAFLTVGALDLVHTLAYSGMGVFHDHDSNLPTQLWIVARYIQVASLLGAPLLIGRRIRVSVVAFGYGVAATLLLVAIFTGWFPAAFVEGEGLTRFKVISEYVIVALLFVAALVWARARDRLDERVTRFMLIAITSNAVAELLFTLYTDVYGLTNLLGHLAKLVSFYYVYRAIVVTGLMRPYDLLFHDLRRSEEALRESQASFQAIVASSSEGILVAEPTGTIVYANAALKGFFACESGGPDCVCPTRPLEIGSFTEVPIRRANGQEGIGEMTVINTRWHGRPGQLATVRDITERKRAEEERATMQARLAEADRLMMVGKMAASLAHEINNPMQAIVGCLGLADEEITEGGDARRYMQIARDEIRRVSRIVGRLRDVHHVSSSEERVEADLGAVLDRVLTLNGKLSQEKGVEVVYAPQEALPPVVMVPDQIQQVFLNLVLNALEAMPNGGRLEVHASASQEPAGVLVTCTDTGVGIPDEELSRVFDLFHSTKPQGSGLGLFISNSIVTQHGGHISVDSRLGEGTTFSVWLPAAAEVGEGGHTFRPEEYNETSGLEPRIAS